MGRLNKERQKKLEPERMAFAEKKIKEMGYEITHKNENSIEFIFKGYTVIFYPYSGWHTGKTIKDGRGINKLLKQIKTD